MDRIILKNSKPFIMKWTVKYDEVFGMPQYVYGRLVNDFKDKPSMSEVLINDIMSLDLMEKKLTTLEGDEYMLVGKGKTMLVLDTEEPTTMYLVDDGLDPEESM